MLSTNSYRAIIFDLDDTLYSEKDYVLSGFRAVATWAELRFGYPPEKISKDLLEIFNSGNRSKTFDEWLRNHRLYRKELLVQMIQTYREHQPVIQPYSDVPELLSGLSGHYHLALLTDGDLVIQKRKLSVLRLASHFEVVICSDEWGKGAWKPNPFCFRFALEKLGVEAEQAIYVGDNPQKDFLGARTARMSTIRLRLPSGLYSKDEPVDSTYAADHEVTSHRQLAQIFMK